MYSEKIEDILLDLENNKIHLAGGSTVGMVLAIVNSLIIYISNLTIGKKKYEDVQIQVKEILKEAQKIKRKSMDVIDRDNLILEQILFAYKIKKDNKQKFQNILKEAVDFGMNVLKIAFSTYMLSEKISKVGNKMLESDFRICKYYAIASVKSALENVKINLSEVNDIQYKKMVEENYKAIIHEIDVL